MLSRRHAARVVALRQFTSTMRGMSPFLSLSLGLAAAAWVVVPAAQSVQIGGVLVSSNPLAGSVTAGVVILAFSLALSGAVTVARERQSGTLEILFYGPIDEFSFVGGLVGGLLLTCLLLVSGLVLGIWLMGTISGFGFSSSIVVAAALSLVPAVLLVSFGVFLSTACRRIRTAVLLFIGVVGLLVGIAAAYALVLLAPIDDPSSPLLVLRDILAFADGVVSWVFPVRYIERVSGNVFSGAWGSAILNVLSAAALAVTLVALSALRLRTKGVAKEGEPS